MFDVEGILPVPPKSGTFGHIKNIKKEPCHMKYQIKGFFKAKLM